MSWAGRLTPGNQSILAIYPRALRFPSTVFSGRGIDIPGGGRELMARHRLEQQATPGRIRYFTPRNDDSCLFHDFPPPPFRPSEQKKKGGIRAIAIYGALTRLYPHRLPSRIREKWRWYACIYIKSNERRPALHTIRRRGQKRGDAANAPFLAL